MKCILLVDDEFGIVDTLSVLLEDEGYRVETAHNGRVALERMKERIPDLVLADLMMPVVDGQELVARVRADPEYAKVPMIIMSAAPESAMSETTRRTLAGFLRKPFDFDELVETIAKVLPP